MIALRKIAVGISLLLAGGCSTGTADKEIQFHSGSSKALVVLGLEGLNAWRNHAVRVNFRGLSVNGKLDKRGFSFSNGNGWRVMQPIEYLVAVVDAGTYVASATVTDIGVQTRYAVYCRGTVRFDAPAGKAVYIGNFTAPALGAYNIGYAAPRFEMAAAKLAEFPNVTQGLVEARPVPILYPKPDDSCESWRYEDLQRRTTADTGFQFPTGPQTNSGIILNGNSTN